MWEQFKNIASQILSDHFAPNLIEDNGDSLVFIDRRSLASYLVTEDARGITIGRYEERNTVSTIFTSPSLDLATVSLTLLAREGLGKQYETAADITMDPLGQLSHGTHPEMKSTADWTRSRYHDPATEDAVWRKDVDFGAVPGTKRAYTDIKALTKDFRIDGIDRTSHVGGSFMAPVIDNVIIPNEFRGTPITAIHEPYRQYVFNVDYCLMDIGQKFQLPHPNKGHLAVLHRSKSCNASSTEHGSR